MRDFTPGGDAPASVSPSADGTFIAVSSAEYQSSIISGVVTFFTNEVNGMVMALTAGTCPHTGNSTFWDQIF